MKDILSVVEACYRVEPSETAWVEGIMHAARPLLDTGLGVFAYVVDASNATKVEMRSFSHTGQPEGFEVSKLLSALAGAPQRNVQRSWQGRSCGFISELPAFAQLSRLNGVLNPLGIGDILAINGLDPTAHGCYLRAALPARGKLNPRKRATWSRVAAHLAAGFRLRRCLRTSGGLSEDAEAVLAPSGEIRHATSNTESSAVRSALTSAARRMDRARSKLRRTSPDEAVEEWRGLVAARWSLVNHFESDGRRYLVARRNDPEAGGPDALTRRERQVLAYAALGHSNKLVAYELGVSASTVGVLLHRAAGKLRVRTRAQLVAAWQALIAAPAAEE